MPLPLWLKRRDRALRKHPPALRLPAIAAAVLAAALLALASLPPARILDTRVSDRQHDPLPVMLPFMGSNGPEAARLYDFSFALMQGWPLPEKYRFSAEGCLRELTVNGSRVDLSAYLPESLCDARDGAVIDLAPYLHEGRNSLAATVEAHPPSYGLYGAPGQRLLMQAGPIHYGLSVSPSYTLLENDWLYPLLIALFAGLAAARLFTDRELRGRPLAVWAAMAGIACLVRLPFFFDSTRGPYTLGLTFWDEATYLNVGRYAWQGHLPYLDLWEHKPPLLFYFFGALDALADGGLAGVRFLGSLVIATTAYAAYLAGRRMRDAQAGWLAGILYIVYVSAGIPSESILTDHLAALPFSFAFLQALKREGRARDAIVAGLLTGISGAIMNNYLIAAPGIALIVCLNAARQPAWRKIRDAVLTCLCSLLPTALFFAFYAAYDEAEAFWSAVIVSGLAQAQIGVNDPAGFLPWRKLQFAAVQWRANAFSPLGPVFWAGTLGLGFCFLRRSLVSRPHAAALAILAGSVFVFTGCRLVFAPNPVYTAGMIWPLALGAGIVLSSAASRNFLSLRQGGMIAGLICAILFALAPSFDAHAAFYHKLARKRALEDDTLYQVAAIINDGPVAHPYIFVCRTEQILYDLTDSRIPAILAHPDNLNQKYIDTVYRKNISIADVYAQVVARRPAYIVGPAGDECYQHLGSAMDDYRLIYTYDRLQLWRRI